jgi:pyrroline-5-carboxylate reductase
MRVTLIGSGNVATVLGKKIMHSGHTIVQVYNRNIDHAKPLAAELSADAVSEIDDNADIYIVAVADDALQHISSWLKPLNGFVVHTAGSVSIDVLKDISANYGVLWPLQSIRKETANAPALPVLIDANNPWNKMKLKGFVQSFADTVAEADDEERRKLHLAAVVTNNFSNYIFSLTEKYCMNEGIDFKLMIPLLTETVLRMQEYSPAELQTGPAIRNDVTTIEKHKELLRGYPEMLEVYEFFTEKIRR